MRRREFITLLTGAAIVGPHTVVAQQTSKVYRIALLSPGPPLTDKSPVGVVLLSALAQRGFTLEQNLKFESRGAMGQMNRLPQMLQEMETGNVDVIVTIGYPTAVAARATGISVVIASGSGDPVATGLVNSLAHPGGTVTGISDDVTTLSTKRLSLLKQLLPNMRRVAMLWNRDDLGMSLRYEASAKAAQVLGITVQTLGVREPDDFNGVFETMDREPPDAILMVSDALTLLNRKRVFDYATTKRIPAIYEADQLVRDGGLMSYGADPKETFARAGDMVARIFKGARPADLPFEQPTRYLFVVNLKTAKSIGLDMPPNLVALADEVIE
jgi:putative ABC transport system substrate-binding protein